MVVGSTDVKLAPLLVEYWQNQFPLSRTTPVSVSAPLMSSASLTGSLGPACCAYSYLKNRTGSGGGSPEGLRSSITFVAGERRLSGIGSRVFGTRRGGRLWWVRMRRFCGGYGPATRSRLTLEAPESAFPSVLAVATALPRLGRADGAHALAGARRG